MPRIFDRRRLEMPCGRFLGPLALTLCLAACGGGGSGAQSTPAPTGGDGGVTTNPPPAGPPPAPTAATVIDVLVVVSEGAAALYGDPGLRIAHLFSVANDILAAGTTATRINLKHLVTVPYPDGTGITDALDDLTFGRHAALADVASLRDAQRADLTVLFRPYANDGYCGFAWVGGQGTQGDFSNVAQANFGYAVVSINCSDYVLLHEIGHNLGLVHSRRENPAGGSLSFGAGYGVDNVFATVMASPSTFNAPQLPVLSSAQRSCNGYPCGVDYRDTNNGAEAARAIGIVSNQVAAYR
jgi:hypothetical protein